MVNTVEYHVAGFSRVVSGVCTHLSVFVLACVCEHYECELCASLCVYVYTCMYVREREESLGRVMLTVGWPWGSQSSSCRWRGWLSASLPTHDGSFIIIRHTVKRCYSGPQDGVVCLWVYTRVCVYDWEWETTWQRQKRKSYLLQ